MQLKTMVDFEKIRKLKTLKIRKLKTLKIRKLKTL